MATPEATVQAYIAALNAGETEQVVRLFAPDAAVMAEGYPTATGEDQLRAIYAGAFQAMRYQYVNKADCVRVWGDTAVVQSHSDGGFTLFADGSFVPNPCRELWALRKSGDEWRISAYMFNHATSATE